MDLTTFQHSPFLSALGNAILNSLWQGLLFWIIYETIVIFYKNTNAKGKHNLSVLFVFSSFIWSIYTFISKLSVSGKTAFASNENNLNGQTAGIVSPFHEIMYHSASILPYLSIAYILLLFFLMIKLFTAYKQVNFIAQKNLIQPEISLRNFASKVAMQLQISKKIKIWISKNVEVPATVGFIKPVILIPFASINNLSVDQLEAIILHEFSHIKRNDYLVNLLVSVIETILFFNPFIAVFIKTIKRERENCCDDFVLQYRYDPHSYASALLKLEQGRNINFQLALGAVSGEKQLLSRIKRITGASTVMQFNYGQKLFALLITTGIFCSLAWISASNMKKEVKPISTESQLLNFNQQKISSKESIVKETSTETKKTVLQKENSGELNKPPIKSGPKEKIINGLDEKQALKEFSLEKNPFIKLKENNSKVFSFENVPKIHFKNFQFNLNKNLKQAYEEISKINWKEVESNINKSFAEIKIEDLQKSQKTAIINAKKYLSTINLEKQQADAAKIIKEFQQQEEIREDSFKQVKPFINQGPKSAEQFKGQKTDLNDTHNFGFGIIQRKSESQGNILEINGRKLNINIRKNSRNASGIRSSVQEIKIPHRIIADI